MAQVEKEWGERTEEFEGKMEWKAMHTDVCKTFVFGASWGDVTQRQIEFAYSWKYGMMIGWVRWV